MLYNWATRGDLPHPTLHHTLSWPTPFQTADRLSKKPKRAGIYTPYQEAQHRHNARRKARTLHDDHTIPRISAPPIRVSDATHNRKITGIIRDCLTPAASRADVPWISEGGCHTRAVVRLNDIQPHKLQRAIGPLAVNITPHSIDHSRCEHHDQPCPTPCVSPLRQPLPAPTITGNIYLGTPRGDPGIYILPNRSREHAIPLHGVESLVLGLPPAKHQHQDIPGDRRSQAPDWGKKAHQSALVHGNPTAHLPKHFGTERHIFLEGQDRHIITAAPYTVAGHEEHWDPTAIPAMPPPPHVPTDPVSPLHIHEPLRRRATPHINPPQKKSPSHRGTPSTQPPNIPASTSSKPPPNGGSSRGHTGSSWRPRPTAQRQTRKKTHEAGSNSSKPPLSQALSGVQGSPNGRDTPEPTEAWVMHVKAIRNYHLHHPFDDSRSALPWPTEARRPYGSPPTSRATAQRRPCKGQQSPRYGTRQAKHPFFQPQAPSVSPPPVPPK